MAGSGRTITYRELDDDSRRLAVALRDLGLRPGDVAAVVQVREGVAPSDSLAEELIAHARSRIALYKAPRSVDFVDSLPRSATGKLVKRKLLDAYR